MCVCVCVCVCMRAYIFVKGRSGLDLPNSSQLSASKLLSTYRAGVLTNLDHSQYGDVADMGHALLISLQI